MTAFPPDYRQQNANVRTLEDRRTDRYAWRYSIFQFHLLHHDTNCQPSFGAYNLPSWRRRRWYERGSDGADEHDNDNETSTAHDNKFMAFFPPFSVPFRPFFRLIIIIIIIINMYTCPIPSGKCKCHPKELAKKEKWSRLTHMRIWRFNQLDFVPLYGSQEFSFLVVFVAAVVDDVNVCRHCWLKKIRRRTSTNIIQCFHLCFWFSLFLLFNHIFFFSFFFRTTDIFSAYCGVNALTVTKINWWQKREHDGKVGPDEKCYINGLILITLEGDGGEKPTKVQVFTPSSKSNPSMVR